ncbi:hypothetical protein [Thalassovita mediterranea]|jgi:hypothetical protein|uniref:Uncharacterized protein n=1 Tax=Thalassovita mediterranea TaxID=340021 RepID=A0A0P1GMC7_9RHOB|nr:hypothetical protein [Thalassovita mediterranea]MCG7572060.1 hypothetical protein [Phaeobacter sp. CNT1-3]CUH83316.1 hypothetical protein TM5383_00501 [Thalassovita mediterranea]SIS33946.1 hypothetical protein SAMN05421685_10953 [Thalassovita mediterranea]
MSAKIVGALITAGVTSLSAYQFWYELGDLMWPSRDVIVAEITLDNRCDFRDYVFVVRDLNSGKYASFAGGRAKLRTRERNRVTVEFAPQYRDVQFRSSEVPVQREMTLVAACSRSPIAGTLWFG